MSYPKASVLIIGNEILSGRTQDQNLQYIAKSLLEKGIEVAEARTISDIESEIIDHVRILSQKYDFLFTTGGIGTTHDDITTAAIAKAFGRQLISHPAIMEKLHLVTKFDPNLEKLALIPKGVDVSLIQNEVTEIPSFRIQNVFVLAGMPDVMRSMMNATLNMIPSYPPFFSTQLDFKIPESILANEMADLEKNNPELTIGSYPYYRDSVLGVNVVLKGRDQSLIKKVADQLKILAHEKLTKYET